MVQKQGRIVAMYSYVYDTIPGAFTGPLAIHRCTAVHTTQIYFVDSQLRQSETGSAFSAWVTTYAEWVRVSEWRWCILFIHLPAGYCRPEPKLFLMTDENITYW